MYFLRNPSEMMNVAIEMRIKNILVNSLKPIDCPQLKNGL